MLDTIILSRYDCRVSAYQQLAVGTGNGVQTAFSPTLNLSLPNYIKPHSLRVTTTMWGRPATIVDDGASNLLLNATIMDKDFTIVARDTAGVPPVTVITTLDPHPIPQRAASPGFLTLALQYTNASTNQVVIETTTDNAAGAIIAGVHFASGTINYITGQLTLVLAGIPAVIADSLTIKVEFPVIYQFQNSIKVGTINYKTGATTINYPQAPDNGASIDAEYMGDFVCADVIGNRNPWSDEEWTRGCYVPIDFKSANLVYRVGTWLNRFQLNPGGWNNADTITVV